MSDLSQSGSRAQNRRRASRALPATPPSAPSASPALASGASSSHAEHVEHTDSPATSARPWGVVLGGMLKQTRALLRIYRQRAGLRQVDAAQRFVDLLPADGGYGWGMNESSMSRIELDDARAGRMDLRMLATLLATYGVRLSDFTAEVEQRVIEQQFAGEPWARQAGAQIATERRAIQALRHFDPTTQARIVSVLEALVNSQSQDNQGSQDGQTRAGLLAAPASPMNPLNPLGSLGSSAPTAQSAPDGVAFEVAVAAAFAPMVAEHAPRVAKAMETAFAELDAWYQQYSAGSPSSAAGASTTRAARVANGAASGAGDTRGEEDPTNDGPRRNARRNAR